MQKPTHLNPGDRVAIVSLSSGILGEEQFRHKYELAKCRLEKDYGLEVVPMQNALRGRVYLYRHPEARAADLMEAFNDPSIKAVFCAVGGNDTVRLLPYIDFETLHNHPKIFMGFSDTTVDHFMMNKAGLVSYYGPAVLTDWAEYGAINDYTREALDKTLFHPAAPLDIRCSSYCSYEHDRVAWDIKNAEQARPLFDNTGYELIQGRGTVSGPLLGGCIDVFPMVIGTAAWPSLDEWRGKLMLLETSERNISPEQLIELLRNLLAQGILHAACSTPSSSTESWSENRPTAINMMPTRRSSKWSSALRPTAPISRSSIMSMSGTPTPSASLHWACLMKSTATR